MKACSEAGLHAAAPAAKGRRIPSTAEDVRAEVHSASARALADFKYGFVCLSVIIELYATTVAGSSGQPRNRVDNKLEH
jgi:hypothetical protein